MTVREALAGLQKQPETASDVSGHSGAQTFYLPQEGGLYLKRGARGALRQDAQALQWFQGRWPVPELLEYESGPCDYMLTRPLPGMPASNPVHCADPARLAGTLGEILRQFHSRDFTGCPFRHNTTEAMLQRAARNIANRHWDESLAAYLGERDLMRAAGELRQGAVLLKNDVVSHGDYCLPNILLSAHYRLEGFLDLGAASWGDRHYDLFWGRWSLWYNLGTDRWGDLFFDAYGRAQIDPRRLRICGLISCFDE